MAKVKPPFVRIACTYANGRSNVTPVKNGIHRRRKSSKKKVAWKSESASKSKPQSL
jgi:hypothetical protein